MKTLYNKFIYQLSLPSIILLLAVSSCKNDDEVIPDTKSKQVTDLAGDTEASVGAGQRPFYALLFSLKNGNHYLIDSKADSMSYLKTDQWDLAFTGNYNSEVFINNGAQTDNPGFGGPVSGTSIVMIDKGYDAVNQAPTDQEFNSSTITKVGWAASSTSPGWFFYSLDNHISVPIKNRTYALRLSNGKYAKLEIQNIYKNNPPVVTDLYWPVPFLSFRYYVQENGSKNLTTR